MKLKIEILKAEKLKTKIGGAGGGGGFRPAGSGSCGGGTGRMEDGKGSGGASRKALTIKVR